MSEERQSGGEQRLTAPVIARLEREALPALRWFADKSDGAGEVRLLDAAPLGRAPTAVGGKPSGEAAYLALFELPERAQHYFIPLAFGSGGTLHEGFASDELVLGIVDDVRAERRRPGLHGGTFAARATAALRELPPLEPPRVRRMNVEQSNTSVVVDERIVLKGYRKTHPGPQPELEIARFLDAVGYRNTPALLGFVEYERPGAQPMAVAILQRFVAARGDGWSVALDGLRRTLGPPGRPDSDQAAAAADEERAATERAHRLGVRTAELHRAFATPGGGPAFEPEPTTQADLEAWVAQARETAQRALDALAAELERVPAAQRAQAAALLARRTEILSRIAAPPLAQTVSKTRYHGDYHLGQVLVAGDDLVIVDFEGEPGRPPEVRRRKSSPLRDVAGMLRSFDYAAVAALLQADPSDAARLEPLAREWERRCAAAFLSGYRAAIGGCSSYPADAAQAAALLDLFALEKACYELSYELANRPAWLRIPLAGIAALLARGGAA